MKTPVHPLWFWMGRVHRRFALVVSDYASAMMATVGMTTLVVLGYVNEYDNVKAGFSSHLYKDDNSVAKIPNLKHRWFWLWLRLMHSLFAGTDIYDGYYEFYKGTD
ncbi:hypothetical protein PsorP6_011723 [Peronosclerospora sorghi]|uniref:Uncharacterized protein n=1 Tax=Peronosclerospora sorghi TaxID=230839 RepID=A0ACC0WHK0_9STRA|nr:hypothetical protein PsorP6_011723 [Peronosclerospora sorghi]